MKPNIDASPHRHLTVVLSCVLVPLIIGLVGALMVSPAAAADQVVTSTADDGSAGTLRAAVTAANSSGGGTISINVAGTITLTAAMPSITQSISLVGRGAGETVIDTDSHRLVHSTSNVDIVLRNLTLTGHTTPNTGSLIHHQNGTTTLDSVEVTGNEGGAGCCTHNGGWGIIYQHQAGVLSIVDSEVHANSNKIIGNDHSGTPSNDSHASPLPDTAYGNRLYISGSSFHSNTGSCVVRTARFADISASSFSGESGVCLDGLNRKRISGSSFTGSGTAIQLGKNATWIIPMTIDDTTISGNTVGIAGAYSDTVITNSTICDNGTDIIERSDVNNPQNVTITDTVIGEDCPPPAPPTTVAPTTTTTTVAPTTTTTAVAPTTTTVAPTTTTTTTAPSRTAARRANTLGQDQLAPLAGVGPGQARSLGTDGTTSPLQVRAVGDGWSVAADGLEVTFGGLGSWNGVGVFDLRPPASITVDGKGFLPGSDAEIWAFSTPTRLSQLTVRSDGAIRAVVQLPASMIGEHTIVVSGVNADGEPGAVALGVRVDASDRSVPSALAFTG